MTMDDKEMIFGEIPTNPLLIVISGPSGIGKDAVVGLLRKTNLDTHFVITMNSRSPRPDEVEGVDYFFVSRKEFEEKIANDELIEYARVYSDYKGIPKSQVKEAFASGKDVIMRLDVQGAMTIRNLCPDAILIFLTASSREEWINRLLERRSETPDELEVRLCVAAKEYAMIDQFDYLVVNSDQHLDQTIADIQAIIKAEHLKTHPRKVEL
jgi:guanylate kinase